MGNFDRVEKPRRYNWSMKGMPADAEAERMVLGSIILEADTALPLAEQHITEHSFAIDSHRKIFRVLREMVEKQQNVDLLSLRDAMTRKLLEEVGGTEYLAYLTENIWRKSDPTSWAVVVREKERKRELITLLHEGIVQLGENETKVDSLISEMEDTILRMLHGGPEKPRTPLEILKDTFEELAVTRAKQRKGAAPGLSWGVRDLDIATTGIRQGEYEVIGGKTGDGKTALMAQSAVANAVDKKKVVIMSVELKPTDMNLRLVAHHGKMSFGKLRDPMLMTDAEYAGAERAGLEIADTGLLIDGCGHMSLQQLESRMRLHVLRGTQIIYFDYLQKLRVPRGMSRYDYFTEASDTICQLAKNTGVPIVMLSQLARGGGFKGKMNPNARPTLNDLKESGQIENDAFCVVLIHRPKEKDGSDSGKDELILAKQRNGSKATIPVEYNGPTLTFADRDEEY